MTAAARSRPTAAGRRAMVVLAAAALSVGGACGDGARSATPTTSDPSPDVASPSATEVPAAAGLLGWWASDLPESVEQYEGGLPPSGSYRLQITEERIVFRLPQGHRFPTHEFVASTDPTAATGTLRIADLDAVAEDGCFEGHLGDEGEYRWSVRDGTLRFEPVADPCVDRPLILGSSVWSRDDG